MYLSCSCIVTETDNFSNMIAGYPCLSVILVPPLQLAKAEKLKPMEVELKRLEDLADAVVNDFAYMRQREQEMRDTNGEESNRSMNIDTCTYVSNIACCVSCNEH